ncbi:MAG: FlgD immunoglobulin-like domain containing protein [Candidatus Neomarinimicrobiota bacterium]
MNKLYILCALIFFATSAASQSTRQVTFVLNTATVDNYTDSTVTGFVTGDYDDWNDWNDTLSIVGDYSSRTMPLTGDSTYKYRFVYKDLAGNAHWESVPDRIITVLNNTTVFHYWNDLAPFTPTDEIDIWFRVNMASKPLGFDPEEAVVAVRGDTPPLGWDCNTVLSRENDGLYYSGLVSFPSNLAVGDTIQYKFAFEQNDTLHYESPQADIIKPDNNRYFIIGNDTTLAFRYFSDQAPAGNLPVTAHVCWAVDMSVYEELGIFSVPREDTMQVRGGFNGWGNEPLPDRSNLNMRRIEGTTIYQLITPIVNFPGFIDKYKYYIKFSAASLALIRSQNPYFYTDMGYENPPIKGGGDRAFIFNGDEDNVQQIGLEYYNGLPPEGVIPDGKTITLTHSVYMGEVIQDGLFNPAIDTLRLLIKDEWIAHIQGLLAENGHHPDLVLNDYGDDGDAVAGDEVYTVTFKITGKSPYHMVYVYQIDGRDITLTEGGGYGSGRFRCRYIHPTTLNPITWPSSFAFPEDEWKTGPPMVVESPPSLLGIDAYDIFPQDFVVSQNYPNLFNSCTTIRFHLSVATDVDIVVYDLLGREVERLIEGYKEPGYHRVNWDGRTTSGHEVPTGIYIACLVTPEHTKSIKMLLLK